MRTLVLLLALGCVGSVAVSAQSGAQHVDADGTAHAYAHATVQIPAFALPPSAYMSEEGKERLGEMLEEARNRATAPRPAVADDDASCPARPLIDELHRSYITSARAIYAVDIERQRIAGVETNVVTPKGGVPRRNRSRVLINLHGGGYSCATRGGLAGQVEAIPIAAVGQIKVIAVDYRTSPEHRFPAATEDVVAVYRDLLESYRPRDIGIYGCSTGATLTATAIAWLQKEKLPAPGEPYPVQPYMRDTRRDDPLAVPVSSLKVLARFPPTLLISGTRDIALSSVVFTDTRLAKAGAE